MIPYTCHEVRQEDAEAVVRTLLSDHLTQGPVVEQFEAAVAEKAGAKYCVAVNSGTAALHLAYLAAGVGPKKGIVTTPITFVATANAALYCGADLEFVDGLPHSASPGLFKALVYTHSIIVPVTLGGDPNHHWITTSPIIVDACQGPLTHTTGALATCFSFHPAKFVATGEGGAIVTNDYWFALQCAELRDHGRTHDCASPPSKAMYKLGFNYRLPELNAALGLSQLARYDWNVAERRKRAAVYDSRFMNHERIRPVPHGPDSARHLYQVLVEDRDAVQAKLLARGIQTQVHYRAVHLQPYYRDRFGYQEGDFPNAEWHADHTLSLPLYPTLTNQEQEYVITTLLEVIR